MNVNALLERIIEVPGERAVAGDVALFVLVKVWPPPVAARQPLELCLWHTERSVCGGIALHRIFACDLPRVDSRGQVQRQVVVQTERFPRPRAALVRSALQVSERLEKRGVTVEMVGEV